MTSLVRRAEGFARSAHEGQLRKYTGDEYVTHVIRVASMIGNYGFSEVEQAAALLNDVVEDCSIHPDTLVEEFGDKVAGMVVMLTDLPSCVGNRKLRKKLDAYRLSQADYAVQSIKYADGINNAPSIKQHDPDFWTVFRREKLDLLDVMTGGNQDLRRQLLSILGDDQ
jgi:(p)ppGpp synthase/HD superfamily hydrolase